MATISVSGQTALLAALKNVKSGDVLSLAGGNYGTVTLTTKLAGAVTITSASEANQAVFTGLTMYNAQNVTIDNVKFTGLGASGNGLKFSKGSGVTVKNSDFSDTKVGAVFSRVTDLTVTNNTFTKHYYDAMNFAGITDAVISKNVYRESGSLADFTHKDFIQFWTNAANGEGTSRNIKIIQNSFYSQDGDTHGIFILNEAGYGNFENITITDNYLKSSHTHGITVASANNLLIQNNTLIKDGGSAPLINVTPDSTNVKIIKNVAPSVADQGNATWEVRDNTESLGNYWHWTNGQTGTPVPNVITGLDLNAPNGRADEFRFKGTQVTGEVTKEAVGVHFDEGDTIVLISYNANTFKYQNGGNLVWASMDGTYVKIDSLVDIQELVTKSPNMSASVEGNDLIIDIVQSGGLQHLKLIGMGHDYQDTFDATLF